MCTSTISSTRISPSAIADERSSFLRGSSMFTVLSSTNRCFRQSAIGAPGGAREIAGVDWQIDAGDRRDVDDGPMAPLRHTHTDAARYHEGTAQVDIALAVPLLHAYLFKPVHLAEYTGGVDEAGDRPVRGLDVGDAVHNRALAR